MITAIVQARMSSTRLPGKVLKDILGRPMLCHLIERLKRSRLIQKIVVATSVKQIDRPILEAAESCGAATFAGSEDDVLDRYYQAARFFQADPVVRITADCPLIDPRVTDQAIAYFLANREQIDYVCNAAPPTYPDGLDTEVFSFAALEKAWKLAAERTDREYPTMYIFRNRGIFRVANVANDRDVSHMRWTVDEPRDFEFVSRIYEALYEKSSGVFGMEDIIAYVKANPPFALINQGIKRNEGYINSLKKENLTIDKASLPWDLQEEK
ncbi:MAG: glycosyltransferase family protein [Candidatus Omnitrophica bacterium]|nr:glycosyltransferase family protein [Candidatus Omnitrophota bacterium]